MSSGGSDLSQPDYGFLDRALHRLALGPKFVRQASFDVQATLTRNTPAPPVTEPVFIAGLARSGSTILLSALHGTGAFRSLTYRDMPFVMMPGLWKSISASSKTERDARERAHGDGMMVEYDSPEALEEVFWRTYCADSYIFADRVIPHRPKKAVCAKFKTYVAQIIASGENPANSRYLSKNNNNLLRLPALRQACPDAQIIVPFREPYAQARSLMTQHEHFTRLHGEDRFSMQYMNWLGHYEFGLGHKQYAFAETANPYQPSDINYWLQCWQDAYRYGLSSAPPGTLFVSYERLCSAAEREFSVLFDHLHLDADPEQAAGYYKPATAREATAGSDALRRECEELHQTLLQACI